MAWTSSSLDKERNKRRGEMEVKEKEKEGPGAQKRLLTSQN